MAISYVGKGQGSGDFSKTSYTVDKPSNVAAGDIMIAAVSIWSGSSGGSRTINPPSGWTLVENRYQSASNPCQLSIFSKVAGSSEPGSYSGTFNSSVGIYATIAVAYRGATGIILDGASSGGSSTSLNTPTLNNPTGNNWRVTIGAYGSGSSNYSIDSNELSYRAGWAAAIQNSGATEVDIWDSGGTVATGNTSRNISRGGSWSAAVAWLGLLDATDVSVPGDLAATLFLPTVSATANQGVDGPLAVTLSKPDVLSDGIATPPSGTLDVQVTPVVSVAAIEQAAGPVSVVVPVTVSLAAETRKFGIRVTVVELEERTVVPLLGADTVSEFGRLKSLFQPKEVAGGDLFRAQLYLPQVDVGLESSPASLMEASLPLPEVLFTGSDNSINVADYGTTTANVQAAANAAAGKRLVFPANVTYTITSEILIPAGCYVEGNNSVFKFPANSTIDASHSDSLLKINGSGVTIDNLNFDGNVDNQGGIWSQHRHAVKALGNWSNCVVKNCDFVNLIGDGCYINVGSGGNDGQNWVLDNLTMVGDNKNRNGVSIIAGRNITVKNSHFTKMARPGMPAAIDIEPNASTDICQDIFITDNDINGGTGGVSGFTAGMFFANANTATANNVQFLRNNVYGDSFDVGICIVGKNGGPMSATTNLIIDNNTIGPLWYDGSTGIELDYWIKPTSISNNTFSTMNYAIYNFQACVTGTTITGNTYNTVFNGSTVGESSPHCS